MTKIVKPIAPVLEQMISQCQQKGSTTCLKDDLESMRDDDNSKDEKETGNDVEADKTPRTWGDDSNKIVRD